MPKPVDLVGDEPVAELRSKRSQETCELVSATVIFRVEQSLMALMGPSPPERAPHDFRTVRLLGQAADHAAHTALARGCSPSQRSALGLVFIWFGALKTLGELSPAYDLVAATVYWLTPETIVPILWLWEVAIGVTFLPLVMLPEVGSTIAPFGLTLEGQYIIVPSVGWTGQQRLLSRPPQDPMTWLPGSRNHGPPARRSPVRACANSVSG